MQFRNTDPRKLTDKQLAEYRGYAGPIRIVGKLTVCRYAYDAPRGKIFVLKAWRGRAIKPFAFYTYSTEERRDNAVNKLVESERANISVNEKKLNEKRSALEKLKKGEAVPFPVLTVFKNSWGYEQTNVDYYEVTAVNGAKLTLRKIGRHAVEDVNWMAGHCQPARGHYVSEPFTKMIQWDGQYYVAAEFGCMSVWDGKKTYWSSYH